ncbi:hypothetical protein [Chondromyces apiculatus]|uniref:Uncharacterized protein n=1 Tax=Chondromyces apiculatus DSM 436 TaxID=1192034 RepID=A0A017SUE3_9BACT|nr:hypothetical protein [Chondromyces apiculatus]EYF00235.1 Hypothetical protein CAP_1049 [Chondromyces apiculatus DSM 436]
MADLRTDLEAYVTVAAELSDPRVDRTVALTARGLDEDAWEEIDDAWQARLSEAEAEAEDAAADGVPPLVAAHAEAFARAQRARVHDVLPFERFVTAASALRRGGDLRSTLRRLDLTLDAYLTAQAHWTARMLEDDALFARFEHAMR